jgi:hypothetical protein
MENVHNERKVSCFHCPETFLLMHGCRKEGVYGLWSSCTVLFHRSLSLYRSLRWRFNVTLGIQVFTSTSLHFSLLL